MAILNYTTTISVDKTLAEIMGMLTQHGANAILVNYEKQAPVALSFVIATQYGDREFRLPANIERVYAVLVRQCQTGKVPRRYATREQAARVGWRIVKDWLEAQLAVIEAEMVTLDEVLLPYLLDEHGQSLYQVMTEKRLLLPGNDDKVRRLPEALS